MIDYIESFGETEKVVFAEAEITIICLEEFWSVLLSWVII